MGLIPAKIMLDYYYYKYAYYLITLMDEYCIKDIFLVFLIKDNKSAQFKKLLKNDKI